MRQVCGAPPEEHRVERHDEHLIAGPLGTPDQALRDLVLLGPVELVPPGRVAGRLRDLLHRVRRGGAGHDGQSDLGSSPCRRELAIGMQDRLDPHRGEQYRRGHLCAEHGRAQIAFRDVAQHARHDPPAPERLEVRPHRVPRARAAPDEAARLGIERLGGPALQLRPGHGLAGQLAGDPAQVDLVLPVSVLVTHFSYILNLQAPWSATAGG